MSIQTTLWIHGGDNPYTLVVEPWARQYEILPGDKCYLVASNPVKQSFFELELNDNNYLIVYVNVEGTNYEFYKNDVLAT
jgi:hypothetical protein